MTEAKLETKSALNFILGGNATFTLRSGKTGTRYTYKVQESDDKPGMFFVKFLTGPNNETDYRYLGMITDKHFRLTKKSAESGYTMATVPVVAFNWVLSKLTVGLEPKDVEIWHAGRCGRCGRTLTVPESLIHGFGPECAKLL